MKSFNELKRGIIIIIENQPYEILEASLMFKGRGHSTLQTRIKNIITGSVVSQTFHPSDEFEEAEIEKLKAKFLYSNRGQFFFCEEKNPAKRFNLTEEQIGTQAAFLLKNQIIEALTFQGKVINVSLPIKVQLRVAEAPPGFQGGRSQPGEKIVTLETGAKINTPLFIEEGDLIEINTETNQYVRRIEKK